jgi:hypothetical protein
LYYWTKYYKQSVSIIYKNIVENWSSRNGTVVLEETLPDALGPYACLSYQDALKGRYARARFAPSLVPYRDFRHFSGRGKPWQAKWLDLEKINTFEVVKTTDPVHYWYFILRKVDRRLDMNLNFANLNVPSAIFGAYPTRSHVHEKVRAAKTTAEDQYNITQSLDPTRQQVLSTTKSMHHRKIRRNTRTGTTSDRGR